MIKVSNLKDSLKVSLKKKTVVNERSNIKIMENL